MADSEIGGRKQKNITTGGQIPKSRPRESRLNTPNCDRTPFTFGLRYHAAPGLSRRCLA
jgi:hypothetical protein